MLYRLKLGKDWKDIEKDMLEMRQVVDGKTEDPGYHYEELSKRFQHGIWEVPGTEAMQRTWRSFYHAIKIHVVIYVVDASETDDARIELMKGHLHVLLQDDKLRCACVCVIFNERWQPRTTKKAAGASGTKPDAYEDELHYRLGLHDLHPSFEWRTKRFNMNISELRGESDRNWLQVLDFAQEVFSDEQGYGLKL